MEIMNTPSFFQNILQLLPLRILLLAEDGTILYCNNTFEEDVEHSAQHCLGKNIVSLFRDATLLENFVAKAQKERMSFYNIEGELITRNGRKMYVSLDIISVSEDSSFTDMPQAASLMLSYKDISTPQVFKEKSQVDESIHSFEYYTRCIIHEIRNPLMAITGASQLLGIKQEKESQAEKYIEMISEESQRIQRILSDIEMVNIDKNLQKTTINIHQPVDRAIMVVEHLELRKEKNITIIKEYDPSLPDIDADMERLVQVFINIIKNGIEASTQNGTIKVETKFALNHNFGHEHRIRKHILVQITDYGKGIPQESLRKIFMPLYSSKREGEGVGLAICHQIINAHNGTIMVESEEGEFTTFKIYLPFQPSQPTAGGA